jgi:D-beta-D-heptose 7-phosphate kinase/D-beta-D-heptose 1-phosphate adenosyltransferase
MNLNRLDQILDQFPSKRILVVGDLMLDEFVWGRVSRISPEAPVPVVEVLRESYYPGGAANVARNVRECGTEAYVMGLIGEDGAGAQLRKILEETGIRHEAIQIAATFQTIVKTRIIARQQQVVRVDRERTWALSPAIEDSCIETIKRLLPQIDAIILEDYGKGFLQQSFVDKIAVLAAGKTITADPNPRNQLQWRGITAVKPNRSEAFSAANEPWKEPAAHPTKDEPLLAIGAKLLKIWRPKQLLITLGEQGMMLFTPEKSPYHIPSRAREVYDLSGAGDTAIAFYTLALLSGGTAVEAAEISNYASSIAVAKFGTATVTRQELRDVFSSDNHHEPR